jgi:PTS system galactitol-specific IIA component
VLVLNEALVLLNLEAPDARAVIEALAGRLHAQALVSADYGQQTYTRELEHPTGLPTKPFCIAFPHADAQGVHESALAVAVLRHPVPFRNMGDTEEELLVSVVLMLANKSPEEQVQTLRNLALLFGQPDKLAALRAQVDPPAAVTWLKQELGLS